MSTSSRQSASAPAIHPLAALLRGFAVDFITGHDLSAVPRIMSPDYHLSIGGHAFIGRDCQYLPATAAQLSQFPGLCVTVHDVVYGEGAMAMQFTEHGCSSHHGYRGATWRGITLFKTDGERIRWGWAEEDYFARKAQLSSGVCDAVDAPHATPWDVRPELPNEAVEEVAWKWLQDPERTRELPDVHFITRAGPQPEDLLDYAKIRQVQLDVLFSAGSRVAFHLAYHGVYKGGFDGISKEKIGEPAILRAAGILTVRDNRVSAARITTDRLGLYRSLL